jgi:hemoglobin
MFDRVGGDAFFDELTHRFYRAVADDPVLRQLYPADDDQFEESRRHFELFLIQFWGGPSKYNAERGEPRLRLRHAPFRIGQTERDAWVRHITDAVRSMGLSPLDETQMLGYFSNAATAMINSA